MREQDTFQKLREAYPGSRLVIVSNTAGTAGDRNKAEASLLERNTGVKVLHHDIKVCPANLVLAKPFLSSFTVSMLGLSSVLSLTTKGVLDLDFEPDEPEYSSFYKSLVLAGRVEKCAESIFIPSQAYA